MPTSKTPRRPPAKLRRTLPPLTTAKPNISDYTHTPGSPVLDRVAALTRLANHGRPGSAIAVDDEVRRVGKREHLLVTEVDHQTGQITVTADGKTTNVLAGVDVEVLALAHHPSPPDNFLDSMTLEQARAAMVPFASDYGRYPQYGADYFNGWVFGRVKRDIRWRDYPTGPIEFPAGQRVLVRTDDRERFGASSPNTYTAYSTRRERHGASIAVWTSAIQLEA